MAASPELLVSSLASLDRPTVVNLVFGDGISKVVFQLRLRRNEGIAIEEIDARCSSKTLEDSQAGSAGTHAGMVHDQRHKDHLRYVGDFDDDML